MRFTSPPVATWLLESCGADEGLIGDLVEQYARNRSPSWYWHETAVATALCCRRTIVHHKWLAVRAILTGWVMWVLCDIVLVRVLERLALVGGGTSWQAWLVQDHLAIALFSYVGWVANGWVIGRLHRPYQAAMVLLYGGFSILIGAPILFGFMVQVVGHPRYNPTLGGSALAIVSLLVGGALSACPSHSPIKPSK